MRRAAQFAVALLLCSIATAADWYVGPVGDAKNPGTAAAPFDIASAMGGGQKVAAGDTLLLLEGTYRRRPQELFEVKLSGTADKPIHVRPVTGKRVTIDGGLLVADPSAHVWVRDLEILVSEPQPEKPVGPGSHPADFTRPWGGVTMHGGKHCKFINLVIRDTRQGISCWRNSLDTEIYGCSLYDNGWLGTDRGHGHCIYTQNKDGLKTISNCIMSARFDGSYSLHAYGSSKADVDNYLIEECIVYERGPMLIGGGKPSVNITARRNFLYGVDLRIGYNAPHNEDCIVRDNVIVNGSLAINKFKTAVNENNLVLKTGEHRPAAPRVELLPNKYDPAHAHLVVYNFAKAAAIDVNVAAFLKAGDKFELRDPKQLFGKPVLEGQCNGATVSVPVSGEFGVFVLLKQ